MTQVKDYIKERDPEAERRFYSATLDLSEVEENSMKTRSISGYAAVFDKDSQDFGGWIERIDKRAFDTVLSDDTFALFNHDPNQVLARNGAGLKMEVDEVGLRYTFSAPNTTLGNDMLELIRSKVITQSSFAFRVSAQEWIHSEDRSKPSIRIVKKVSRLYDVSPVTYPAYPDTTVGTRSFKVETEPRKTSDEIFLQLRKAKQGMKE